MLTGEFLKKYKDATPPWGPVGYITYKRTYSRNDGSEEWWQTIKRVVDGLHEIGGVLTQKEEEQLFDFMFNLKGCVSGRALWQLGSKTIRQVGSDSMQNCWHVAVDDYKAFCFAFNQLMLGGGVGFNVLPEYVYKLPKVKRACQITKVDSYDCDFIVPDNREGWVELLERVLQCFFLTGEDLTYTTLCVREKGAKINTFGGIASGPDSLNEFLGNIVQILKSRAGTTLRAIDCLDIMNNIGEIVVSGNVRRSSQIALGSHRDEEFLRAKNWNIQQIPNWRRMSNNSVVINNIFDLPEEVWESYYGNGEPLGLVNIRNCRRFGRLTDGLGYRRDPKIIGLNPCGEITLESKEPCNLADIFLVNIENEEEFEEVARILFKACKTIANMDFSDPDTRRIVKRNQRIGIGVTGFMAAHHLRDEQIFDNVYRSLEEVDLEYSKMLGCRNSRKQTTVKPSGTLSLLPDSCTPGAHVAYSEFVIRRIQFSANNPIVQVCKDAGHKIETLRKIDGTEDPSTVVIDFYMQYKGCPTEKNFTAVDQLNNQKWLQTWWSDNSVSQTVYYKKEEVPAIRDWLEENYNDSVKCTSFMLHSGHGFDQAPFEEITEKRYLKLKSKLKPLGPISSVLEDDLDPTSCSTEACPVR